MSTETSDRLPTRKEEIDFNEILNENPKTGAMYTVMDLFDDLIRLVRADMRREAERSGEDLRKKELYSSIDTVRRYVDVLQALAQAREAWFGLFDHDLQLDMETLVQVLGS